MKEALMWQLSLKSKEESELLKAKLLSTSFDYHY